MGRGKGWSGPVTIVVDRASQNKCCKRILSKCKEGSVIYNKIAPLYDKHITPEDAYYIEKQYRSVYLNQNVTDNAIIDVDHG